MKQMNLVAIQPRSFKPRTTQSRHTLGYNPNLLIEVSKPTAINRIWVADITYIPVKNSRFAYLALIMDLYSRRIVGWDLREHMKESLTLNALQNALAIRRPQPGLIHHSDRGGQYAGKQYRALLRRARIEQSMSRAADCYDNAYMESCFGTIKTELEMSPYDDLTDATRRIKEYIGYYNIDRRHSAIGYNTPHEFENR